MNTFSSFWRDEVSNIDKKIFYLCLKLTYILLIMFCYAGNATGKTLSAFLILL